jgi:hypothetical protein
MGLDTTHGCWHGSYTGFNCWRNELARAAGYKLREPDIAEGIVSPLPDLHWDAFEDKNYQGEWDAPPGDDPLLFLLAHSDCDGVIHPEHGIHLARRLEHLVPLLQAANEARDAEWMSEMTRRFIKGLREAAAAGEDVKFA